MPAFPAFAAFDALRRATGPRRRAGGLLPLGMALAEAAGANRFVARLTRARFCLLTFHRVSTTDTWADRPNRDFYVDAVFLDQLLRHLRVAGWQVVTVDEALRRLASGSDAGRFVNISIDDTYRDTAELAVPLFRRHGVPVTLFVTTGIPDETLCMWTAGLETVIAERDEILLPEPTGPRPVRAQTPAEKQALYSRLSRDWESRQPELLYERLCALNGFASDALHRRHAMTWPMLEALAAAPDVEIGGHTVSHPRLSALSAAEAADEIAGCRRRLQERLRVPVRHFAFPYGRRADCGSREFGLAREAGYASAATTRKGVVSRCFEDILWRLPRNTLNGSNQRLSQIESHVSGLSGVAARFLGAG